MGIGTSSPWRILSITGTVGFDGLTAGAGAGALCLDANKQVTYSDGAACTGSSQRFKHDIIDLDDGLATIMALRPVAFTYNDDIGVKGRQVGLIAEEVEKIDPRLISLDANGLPVNVKYANLTATLALAIQEQQAQIEKLDKLINEDGKWKFDDKGVLTVTEIKTDKLCIGSTCINEETLKAILKSSGLDSPASSNSTVSSVEEAPNDATSSPKDSESPVISLLGDSLIELKVGDSFIDPGATVKDNLNDNLGIQVKVDGKSTSIPGAVDTSVAGEHTITYNTTDGAGNKAEEKSRVVKVVGAVTEVAPEVAEEAEAVDTTTSEISETTETAEVTEEVE